MHPWLQIVCSSALALENVADALQIVSRRMTSGSDGPTRPLRREVTMRFTKRWLRGPVAIAFAVTFMLFGVVAPSAADSDRATRQLSGVAHYDSDSFSDPGECDSEADEIVADFYIALVFSGEGLVGCWYLIPESARTTPSGMLIEEGKDIFVGTLDGEAGRFETTYIFRGKYEDLNDPSTELFGFCQHKLVSGEGAFEGVRGMVHIRDDVVNFEFPWTAQLKQR